MLEKHLRRIKKAETGVPEEDEWEEIPTLGQKLEEQIIEEVPDRTVRIERIKKSNFQAFEEDSPKVKDDFHNAAQYAKLVKSHLKEKKIECFESQFDVHAIPINYQMDRLSKTGFLCLSQFQLILFSVEITS